MAETRPAFVSTRSGASRTILELVQSIVERVERGGKKDSSFTNLVDSEDRCQLHASSLNLSSHRWP